MTVGELMEELGKYDKDLPVWIYDNGPRVRIHGLVKDTFEHRWRESTFEPGVYIEHTDMIEAIVLNC